MSAPKVEPPSADTAEAAPATAATLDAELCAMFAAVVSQPVPDDVVALIDRLDAGPGPVGEARSFDAEPTD